MRLTEDEIVAALPPWHTQVRFSVRSCCQAGAACGGTTAWRLMLRLSCSHRSACVCLVCGACWPVTVFVWRMPNCRHAPVQITFRAIVVGICLGVAYGFITMRFALGPFGVVPTFNMPMVSCWSFWCLVLLFRHAAP